MRRQLLDVLACPVCKHHPLSMEVDKEDEKGIQEGKLTCPNCGRIYPISEGIPDMIPPEER